MQVYRNEIGDPPIFKSLPLARTFPPEWRDVWFRRQARSDEHGVIKYICPLCGRGFDHRQIEHLQGDHIWPYSLFGETSWSNYQLICGSCNAAKGNRLENDVRRVLGAGEFRRIVSEFLALQIESRKLADDPFIRRVLGLNASDREDAKGEADA
jgi:hypothetical protein